jgi:DNA polymerase-3 subunit alpha
MMSVYEGLVESAQNSNKKNLEGQMSLFDFGGEEIEGMSSINKLPDVTPFSKEIALAMEKEMLGVYITDHPLNEYADKIKEITSVTSEELNRAAEEVELAMEQGIEDGRKAIMAGMVASKKTLITKSNKMMAFLVLEDLYGVSEIVVFPNVYEKYANLLQQDSVIAVSGTLNFKEDEAPKLLADAIMPLEEATAEELMNKGRNFGRRNTPSDSRGGQPAVAVARETQPQAQPEGMIKVKIPTDANLNATLEQIKFTLQRHSGMAQVLIYLPDGKILKTDRDLWAEPSVALRNQLIAILGHENVKM